MKKLLLLSLLFLCALTAGAEAGILSPDSLFRRYATSGFASVKEDLRRYYDDVLDPIPTAPARAAELEKLRTIIHSIGSPALGRELDYAEALAMPEDTPELLRQKLQRFRQLADKYASRGDTEIELRALTYLFCKFFFKEFYHDAFLCGDRLARRLEATTEKDFSGYYQAWADLAYGYYHFRDYDRAVPYLKKALRSTPATSFNDRSNLRARAALGDYYQLTARLDSSDHYFQSMLHSRDSVKLRPMFDCIALSNLGTNLRLRRRYTEALTYHRAALPAALAEQDWSFTSGIYVGLAECYLETGNPALCRLMLDSARHYISLAPWMMSNRSCDLYPMEARYYAAIGNNRLSMAYMDSTVQANRRQESTFNAMVVLRADQEVHKANQQQKDLEINTFRRISILSGGIACIIFVALLVIVLLYRKKRRDYRKLVARSCEWAEQTSAAIPQVVPAEADDTDLALMESIGRMIEIDRIHLDCECDLDSLAQHMGLHRNLISKAVNAVHHKTFNAFINEYRVRDAICLLSDPKQDIYSPEKIGYDTGFGSRQTFYRVFKAHTGVNPGTFRKNRNLSIEK